MKRYFSLLVSILLVLSLFTGCGSSSSYDGAVAENAPVEEMGAMNQGNDYLASPEQSSESRLPANRKWVITSEVRAETDDLDQALEAVLHRVGELSGYVEDQNFDNGSYYSGYGGNRSARLTIRVPAEHVDSFMETVKEKTNVVSSSRNLQDITLQYSDTETRIAALKAEEERLLKFMEQAETMADLLEIERRLTDVHYELENVTSRLRTYDNQVNYATIHFNLEEVREYTPVEEPTFLERITQGFRESLAGVGEGIVDFVVLIIVGSPYLVVWALIGLVVFWIVKVCKKKNKKMGTAEKKQEAAAKKEIPQEWKKFDEAVREKKDDKK